ncbi:YqgQ family protein [Weissella coleopterorum]|uniref:YqgQ family protein n=1 Tax=Weissella coleopterorum TaxID=2714949 RepID=A0A6G8B1K5_9LACO|nr:YqgQ family protein [Weissella coleopterorum]QIL51117.1 YqgQ family protein [Weissella coleopterorum]
MEKRPMQTFKDVLNLLKVYDIYIHVGERLWDLELAAIEVDNLAKADLIDNDLYLRAKLVLEREHRLELKKS